MAQKGVESRATHLLLEDLRTNGWIISITPGLQSNGQANRSMVRETFPAQQNGGPLDHYFDLRLQQRRARGREINPVQP